MPDSPNKVQLVVLQCVQGQRGAVEPGGKLEEAKISLACTAQQC